MSIVYTSYVPGCILILISFPKKRHQVRLYTGLMTHIAVVRGRTRYNYVFKLYTTKY